MLTFFLNSIIPFGLELLGYLKTNIIRTDLRWSIKAVGLDLNALGDGSGVVLYSVSATNAIGYGFKFGNEEEQESTIGLLEHTFIEKGVNEYTF